MRQSCPRVSSDELISYQLLVFPPLETSSANSHLCALSTVLQLETWAQHNKAVLGGKDLTAKLSEVVAGHTEQTPVSKQALLDKVEQLLDSNLVVGAVIDSLPFECQLLVDAKELLS
jgi:hypothetical protein